MSLPHSSGLHSRQAHCDLPADTYEREIGREGFSGPATQMYHKHPPTGWSQIEGPVRPRAFDLTQVKCSSASPWEAVEILSNAHMSTRRWDLPNCMRFLCRNADGDDLLFLHEGKGNFYCDYGHISISEGDYVLIPRGTMWRIEVEEAMSILMIEATNDSFRLPDKGVVGKHAIFDPAVLRVPKICKVFQAQQSEKDTDLLIKRNNVVTTMTFPYNPLDAVGWCGDNVVVVLNWRDIRPLTSHRYHLPPTAHASFVSTRFLIATFCPRPIETDPGALKVPFFHSNDDYDEIIFYHKGTFFSRDNIKPGMMTYHPVGFAHGPHPKAFQVGKDASRSHTDEVAVMIDTRDGVDVAKPQHEVEVTDYVNSWQTEKKNNPTGLLGISFVEWAGPKPEDLDDLFRKFGFSMTGMMKDGTDTDFYLQNDIKFLLTREKGSFGESFGKAHGQCICSMGWLVRDAKKAFDVAVAAGARPYKEGKDLFKNVPAIYGIGDSLLYFVESHGEFSVENFFKPHTKPFNQPDKGFLLIDHLTNNVEQGTMHKWADFYKDIFGFTEVRFFDIRGEETGLKSFALRSPDGSFCIPINEATEDKSQIAEYLRDYNGAGIQHVAFLSDDILGSLDYMKGSDVIFLDMDDEYYSTVFDRVPHVKEDKKRIQNHQVLVDGDSRGYLLQIFTTTIVGPIFIELIQRNNHNGFGEGNFGALFRSMERDQKRRGTL